MVYNPASGKYEKTLLLKQGSYNYQYLFLPDGGSAASAGPIEGNYYETVNKLRKGLSSSAGSTLR